MEEYLLLDKVCSLVVDDGSQAMGVRSGMRVQAEVQADVDGGEFITEILLILDDRGDEEQSQD